ncbi:hypothetical protein [Halobaculum magnesiiphilum]|uniref:Domain of unknown function domain-containing protein n=1 Tax=Halobaculum magnesiiphilum TaxID=1017351 RepID=A0A8T8WEU8_9EURY|nr:hypothetical protein [Halobaculum magnesiiphilum]QZP38253.1 hypothetical protein K6T50_03600 [Halobaculum magnesiiphilum]
MTDDRDIPSDQLFTGVEDVDDDRELGPILTPEDRPRGILSPTDREYLCGHKEYAQPQTDANRRQAIRERIVNGLKDFALLSVLLEPGERDKVFAELGQEETDEALASMVAFAYLGVEGDRHRLETCLEHGILQGATVGQFSESGGRATDADVSISVEYDPNIEALYQRFEDDGELTDAEIGALVRAGRIGGDDLEELAESSGGFPGVFVGKRAGSRE